MGLARCFRHSGLSIARQHFVHRYKAQIGSRNSKHLSIPFVNKPLQTKLCDPIVELTNYWYHFPFKITCNNYPRIYSLQLAFESFAGSRKLYLYTPVCSRTDRNIMLLSSLGKSERPPIHFNSIPTKTHYKTNVLTSCCQASTKRPI